MKERESGNKSLCRLNKINMTADERRLYMKKNYRSVQETEYYIAYNIIIFNLQFRFQIDFIYLFINGDS